MLALRKISVASPALPTRARVSPRLVCRAQLPGRDEEDARRKAMTLPVATMVAAALLSSAFVPDEALAARSSGRAGGSSGFAARKAAPSRTSTTVSSTTVVAPVVVAAPPVFSPFGFGGFGMGYGFAPTIGFGVPFGFFGGMFSIFIFMFAISALVAVVRGVADATKKDKKDDDSWGSL